MTVTTEMDEAPQDNCPPENLTLYRMAIAEASLRQIAAVEWPVNVYGASPQKIAREALKQ